MGENTKDVDHQHHDQSEQRGKSTQLSIMIQKASPPALEFMHPSLGSAGIAHTDQLIL